VDAAGLDVPGVERPDIFMAPPPAARALLFADPDSETARALLPDVMPPERAAAALRAREAAARLLWHPHEEFRRLASRLWRITAQTLVICGAEDRLLFFASRLKYSRWVAVHVVEDERIEALVRSLLASFASFGGVVLVAVFDNPKTVTLGRDGGRILWNETFGQVALDYGFGVELCTPGRGQEKAEVEQLHGALLAHGPAALQRSLAVAGEQRLYAAHHVLELMPSRVR
jgi:hypothetical protein